MLLHTMHGLRLTPIASGPQPQCTKPATHPATPKCVLINACAQHRVLRHIKSHNQAHPPTVSPARHPAHHDTECIHIHRGVHLQARRERR